MTPSRTRLLVVRPARCKRIAPLLRRHTTACFHRPHGVLPTYPDLQNVTQIDTVWAIWRSATRAYIRTDASPISPACDHTSYQASSQKGFSIVFSALCWSPSSTLWQLSDQSQRCNCHLPASCQLLCLPFWRAASQNHCATPTIEVHYRSIPLLYALQQFCNHVMCSTIGVHAAKRPSQSLLTLTHFILWPRSGAIFFMLKAAVRYSPRSL